MCIPAAALNGFIPTFGIFDPRSICEERTFTLVQSVFT
jgi:hypothetical protein